MVSWDEVPPIDQNGIIINYRVLYQPLETFGGAIGPLNVNVSMTDMSIVLMDLEEYVSYNISVQAFTSAGEGPYSDGVLAMTNEDGNSACKSDVINTEFMRLFFLAPASPPSNVTATVISPTSIMVTWDMVPPIDQNGVITMYEVLYEPLETFGGAIGPLTSNSTAMSLLLTGLEEFVNYNISVRAYTSVGAGPYSEDITEMTSEDGEFCPCIKLWLGQLVLNGLLLQSHISPMYV